MLVLCSLLILTATPSHSLETGWTIVDARWRPDANPFAEKQVWDDWIWVEGWKAEEQFYPDHFQPAGSLHVILRNGTDRPAKVALVSVNGTPADEITTTPEFAGAVIWHRVEPDTVQPGRWAEAAVRLRSPPVEGVSLTFRTEAGKSIPVTVPVEPARFRIESISFSPAVDHVRVYVGSLEGKRVRPGTLRLDGEETGRNARWTEGPGPGDLALVEADLDPPWKPGSRHLVEVELPRNDTLAESVRAWDGFFEIGLYSGLDPESLRDAVDHGINTIVTWTPQPILDDYGLNSVPSAGFGEGRVHTRDRSGILFYANRDEPDAHDFRLGRALPLADRLGVHAQGRVLPLIRDQRKADPATLNMVLVDNTFKPLNWYVYGLTGDVLCTDPYVPLTGEQLGRVPHSLAVARDASAPNPLLAVIWAAVLTGSSHHYAERAPTPEEERMMVFYALGSGVKGLSYFMDQSQPTAEGEFIGLSDIPDLWDEVGRINRDVSVLVPYLSAGCPVPGGYEDQNVWSRMLWGGGDSFVLFVVNRNHFIAFNTRTTYAWHRAAEDVDVPLKLPKRWRRFRVREVVDGALRPFEEGAVGGGRTIHLDRVNTARAFVISRGDGE